MQKHRQVYVIDFTIQPLAQRAVWSKQVETALSRVLRELFSSVQTFQVQRKQNTWVGCARCPVHGGEIPFMDLEDIALTIEEGMDMILAELFPYQFAMENMTVAFHVIVPKRHDHYPLAS